MTLVLTLMVRDEADLIAPFMEHHLAQGIDRFIITDNGSRDGTMEILRDYATRAPIDLRFDPVHRKQQGETVTRMARDAATLYGADWTINADADEMWVPKDPSLTLRDLFERMPRELRSFTVPVIDMTGPAAWSGSGLQRLVYRDSRPDSELVKIGLRAHSTPDAVHVGDPEVRVGQGNHIVSIASQGAPPEELELEVLHFPWRSWDQYRRKVENAGRAYLESPHLTPSPNHHGMIDYDRLVNGTLLGYFLLRHPDEQALREGIEAGWFVEDRRIADELASPIPDALVSADLERVNHALVASLADAQARIAERQTTLSAVRSEHEAALAELGGLSHANEVLRAERDSLAAEVDALRRRRVVRLTDAIGASIPGWRP
jgi:hypothetical protein